MIYQFFLYNRLGQLLVYRTWLGSQPALGGPAEPGGAYGSGPLPAKSSDQDAGGAQSLRIRRKIRTSRLSLDPRAKWRRKARVRLPPGDQIGTTDHLGPPHPLSLEASLSSGPSLGDPSFLPRPSCSSLAVATGAGSTTRAGSLPGELTGSGMLDARARFELALVLLERRYAPLEPLVDAERAGLAGGLAAYGLARDGDRPARARTTPFHTILPPLPIAAASGLQPLALPSGTLAEPLAREGAAEYYYLNDFLARDLAPSAYVSGAGDRAGRQQLPRPPAIRTLADLDFPAQLAQHAFPSTDLPEFGDNTDVAGAFDQLQRPLSGCSRSVSASAPLALDDSASALSSLAPLSTPTPRIATGDTPRHIGSSGPAQDQQRPGEQAKLLSELQNVQKLVFGLVFGLEIFASKATKEPSPVPWLTCATSVYRLTCYTTATGLRFVMITDPGPPKTRGKEVIDVLKRIFREIYIPKVARNPLCDFHTPGSCSSQAFATALDDLVATVPFFHTAV